jgi:tetratricopeptide (TPR) repeat protein
MGEFIANDLKGESTTGASPIDYRKGRDAAGVVREKNSRFFGIDFGLITLIALGVLTLYWPVRTFDYVDLDDPQYVFANPHVLGGLSRHALAWAFTSQTGGLWQPLTMLSFMTEVWMHGAHPGWMHLDNVFLHALSSIGWYVLLRGMTGRKAPAFFTAAIFALHPLRVESVAWITERKDVLSMLMLVLSLIAYWRYTRRSNVLAYLASVALFVLALMSKAMVVTQPALMLLLDCWPLGRTRWCTPADPDLTDQHPSSVWRLLLEKIPFFAFSAIESFIALKTQSQIGARPDLVRLPLGDRLSTAIVGYVKYLGSLFIPGRLAVFYPYQMNLPLVIVFSSATLLLIITAVSLRLWRSKPYFCVGWIWFLLAMVPVSGLFQAGNQSIADRFSYLPSVGVTFAAVWITADAVQRRKRLGPLATFIGIAVLAGCAAVSRDYLWCWKDTISLFSRAADANRQPDPFIELHLGDAYMKANRPDLAIDHYGMAVQLDPNNASTQINLANLLMQTPPQSTMASYEYQAALLHYQRAILLKPMSVRAHYNCAVCLRALQREGEAQTEFNRAAELKEAQSEP